MIDAAVYLANDGEPMFESTHFCVVPAVGQDVEIEGQAFIVSEVIHTPNVFAAGPKLRVTLRSR